MDIERAAFRCRQLPSCDADSVPMALGKHLFPCRTQQLSLAAVTILALKRWENSTVPNYVKSPRKRALFFWRPVLFSLYTIKIADHGHMLVVGSYGAELC
jgi:hypothetical protein